MGQHLGVPTRQHIDEVDLFAPRLSLGLKRNSESFPDLKLLPPEIGLQILSNVDARELRLCREFWEDLANDDLLWRRLCYSSWGYCTAYKTPRSLRGPHFWKSLFNTLESATDSFNQFITEPPYTGLNILQSMNVLNDDPQEISEFILNTELLKTSHIVALFRHRYDVLECYLKKHDFTGWFLPIALRSFFFKLSISTRRQSGFTAHILDIFTKHYCDNNPSFHKESLLIVVHSLVLLSNDLCNPCIKNKMSKREYIKNTLQAVTGLDRGQIDSDFLCHIYDNVYLIGHVTPDRLTYDS